MVRVRRNGSKIIHRIAGRVLDGLEKELENKPHGYATTIALGKELLPETKLPSIEIILLDPCDKTVAFRTIPNLPGEEGGGKWRLGELYEAVEEAFYLNIEAREQECFLCNPLS